MVSGTLFSRLQAYMHRLQPMHFPRSITIPNLTPVTGFGTYSILLFCCVVPIIWSNASSSTLSGWGRRMPVPPTAVSLINSLRFSFLIFRFSLYIAYAIFRPYKSPPLSFLDFFKKGSRRSMGTGNIVVEFLSVATSTNVWRNLSCIAVGWVPMIAAASASF